MRSSEYELGAFNTTEKPTLMIVDDEQNFAESLRMAIEDTFTVSVAVSLERARQILKNGVPDVILLDLRLPDGYGVELLNELEGYSRLPIVIVMTAFATVDSFIRTQQGGAVDYFNKPLDIAELKRVIKIELKRRAS